MRIDFKKLTRQLRESPIAALRIAPSLATVRLISGRCGFFGDIFCALNGLRLAEKYRLVAKFDWGSSCLYFDHDRTEVDAWSTFFKQNKYDFRVDTSSNKKFISFPLNPGAYDFEPYPGLSIRQSVSRAIHAWCQPRKEISVAIENAYKENFEQRPILGVHIRLTDTAMGVENRKTVSLQHFFDSTDDWLIKRTDAGIFLATDDLHVTKAFTDRYGSRVIFQPCLRSEDGASIHGHYDNGVSGSPYQKGREVLIDALLLARCNHLIRTHSRVTAYSLCWSPNLSFTCLENKIYGEKRLPWLFDSKIYTVSTS